MPQLCPFNNHVCNEHCARWDDEECCCIDISLQLTVKRLVKTVRLFTEDTQQCAECGTIVPVDDMVDTKEGYICLDCANRKL